MRSSASRTSSVRFGRHRKAPRHHCPGLFCVRRLLEPSRLFFLGWPFREPTDDIEVFDLPVEPGLRVSFVAPGNDCTAAPIAAFTVDSVPAERDEGLALWVSGTLESDVEGTVVPQAEGLGSLRNGCGTGSDGSCDTRGNAV